MSAKVPAKKGQHQTLSAGDIFSFRTEPLTRFSAKITGRYAALKILAMDDTTTYFLALEGAFDHPPTLDEVSTLQGIMTQRGPACRGSNNTWENELVEFSFVGRRPLSPGEQVMPKNCRAYGPWSGVARIAEHNWRKAFDAVACADELKRERDAQQNEEIENKKRLDERLSKLTIEQLLNEKLLPDWDRHPPFPDGKTTSAVRKRLRDAITEVVALGRKPTKATVRKIIKALVVWLNSLNEECDGPIETEEREDLLEVIEELAFVAGHHALLDEVDEWRTW